MKLFDCFIVVFFIAFLVREPPYLSLLYPCIFCPPSPYTFFTMGKYDVVNWDLSSSPVRGTRSPRRDTPSPTHTPTEQARDIGTPPSRTTATRSPATTTATRSPPTNPAEATDSPRDRGKKLVSHSPSSPPTPPGPSSKAVETSSPEVHFPWQVLAELLIEKAKAQPGYLQGNSYLFMNFYCFFLFFISRYLRTWPMVFVVLWSSSGRH